MNPSVTILTTCHPVDDVRVFEKEAWSFKQAGFAINWLGPDWRLNGEAGEKLPGVPSKLFGKGRGVLGRTVGLNKAYRVGRTSTRPAVYYCPEPDAAFIGLALARRNGARVLLDLHEVYEGNAKSNWGVAVTVTAQVLLAGRGRNGLPSRARRRYSIQSDINNAA